MNSIRLLVSLFVLSIANLTMTNAFAENDSVLGGGNDGSSFGATEEEEFLPVEEAFVFSARSNGSAVELHWDIAEGYYLYQERMSFKLSDESSAATLGEPQFSRQGKEKDDPSFGIVKVFHKDADVSLPITVKESQPVEVQIRYQGCAEAGLCYPPQRVRETFTIQPGGKFTATPVAAKSAGNTASKGSIIDQRNDSSALADYLAKTSFLGIITLFFILGVGLTFTPCVLPMVPILSSIIVGQGKEIKAREGFMLSSAYVLGMASTYAIAGVLVAASGAKLQLYMQMPAVLYTFAGIFVLLSLSMFGFYELQLPAFIRDPLNNLSQKQEGGNLISTGVMGFLSALVVSPCVSAPLAGALIYISTTGNIALGGMALLALGLGMGLPLIVIGTTGANVLPQAGMWMDRVKAVFGVLILAVAAYLVKHLLPAGVMLMIWALLAILLGLYLGALDPAQEIKGKLTKGMGLASLSYGIMLVVGAATGASNPLQPLKPLNMEIAAGNFSIAAPGQAAKNSGQNLLFERVRSIADLEAKLAQAQANGNYAMIDYYADWCISCIEMEHGAFSDPRVIDHLNSTQLIQIDLTNNDEAEALLDRYGLFGPPSILFFAPTGEELKQARVMGMLTADQFLGHVKNHIQS